MSATQVPIHTASWVTDLPRLCDRLTVRLAAEGACHPATAAAVLLARGDRGLPAADWAVELGVTASEVDAAERGDVALAELPPPLLRAVRDLAGLDLTGLLGRDTDAARTRHPASRARDRPTS